MFPLSIKFIEGGFLFRLDNVTITSFNSVSFSESINAALARKGEGKDFKSSLVKAAKEADNANLGSLVEYAPNLIGFEGRTWSKYVLPILAVIVGKDKAVEAGKSVEGVVALVGDTQLCGPGKYGYTKVGKNPLYQAPVMQGDVVLAEAVGSPTCPMLTPVAKFSITEYVKCVYEAHVCPCCTSLSEYNKLKEVHKGTDALAKALLDGHKDAILAGLAFLWTKQRDMIKSRIESSKASLVKATEKADLIAKTGSPKQKEAAEKRVELAKVKVLDLEEMLKKHLNTNVDGTPKTPHSDEPAKEEAGAPASLSYEELKVMAHDKDVTLESLLAEGTHLTAREQSTLKGMWTKSHK